MLELGYIPKVQGIISSINSLEISLSTFEVKYSCGRTIPVLFMNYNYLVSLSSFSELTRRIGIGMTQKVSSGKW
jgi:hypothetical protein